MTVYNVTIVVALGGFADAPLNSVINQLNNLPTVANAHIRGQLSQCDLVSIGFDITANLITDAYNVLDTILKQASDRGYGVRNLKGICVHPAPKSTTIAGITFAGIDVSASV